MTKGYRVQETTAKGQNALAPTLCFVYVSSDRWSKYVWSDHEWESVNEGDQIAFCAFHSFLVEVQNKLATYVLCMRNINLESTTVGDKRSLQQLNLTISSNLNTLEDFLRYYWSIHINTLVLGDRAYGTSRNWSRNRSLKRRTKEEMKMIINLLHWPAGWYGMFVVNLTFKRGFLHYSTSVLLLAIPQWCFWHYLVTLFEKQSNLKSILECRKWTFCKMHCKCWSIFSFKKSINTANKGNAA